jgi:hypothetical protein
MLHQHQQHLAHQQWHRVKNGVVNPQMRKKLRYGDSLPVGMPPSNSNIFSFHQDMSVTSYCFVSLQAMEADAPVLDDASDNKRLV